MLPGKAKRLPVPMMLRARDVQNAMPVPYTGPRNTPAITLTRCWAGKHLDAPIGIEKPESATASAVSMPLTASLFIA